MARTKRTTPVTRMQKCSAAISSLNGVDLLDAEEYLHGIDLRSAPKEMRAPVKEARAQIEVARKAVEAARQACVAAIEADPPQRLARLSA